MCHSPGLDFWEGPWNRTIHQCLGDCDSCSSLPKLPTHSWFRDMQAKLNAFSPAIRWTQVPHFRRRCAHITVTFAHHLLVLPTQPSIWTTLPMIIRAIRLLAAKTLIRYCRLLPCLWFLWEGDWGILDVTCFTQIKSRNYFKHMHFVQLQILNYDRSSRPNTGSATVELPSARNLERSESKGLNLDDESMFLIHMIFANVPYLGAPSWWNGPDPYNIFATVCLTASSPLHPVFRLNGTLTRLGPELVLTQEYLKGISSHPLCGGSIFIQVSWPHKYVIDTSAPLVSWHIFFFYPVDRTFCGKYMTQHAHSFVHQCAYLHLSGGKRFSQRANLSSQACCQRHITFTSLLTTEYVSSLGRLMRKNLFWSRHMNWNASPKFPDWKRSLF
jgi:hypothetical protein